MKACGVISGFCHLNPVLLLSLFTRVEGWTDRKASLHTEARIKIGDVFRWSRCLRPGW